MRLNVLMMVNAVIAAVFGIAFVVVAGPLVSLYGVTASDELRYVGQLFGSALVALAIVTWQARNAADSDARRAIVLGLAIGNTVGFVVALIGQLGAVVNALGWSTVVIYVLLALGFWYFALQRQAPAAA
jgi:hypothetical protein